MPGTDIGSPATDEETALAGHRIGRYTIRSRMARGGMAEIFLAEARDLPGVHREVVLKRMLPELARDPEHGRMFLDEARIMASLVHPNVVQVVEVGREGDELFIAMERIDGASLSSLMADGQPLPLPHAVHIVAGALAGLHYVHERRDPDHNPMQLIHRDVSPRNVLVTRQGAVKLIDFGIARQGNRLGQTRSGIVKGTIPYMSPEQCRGLHLDRRTDVFSTGILLWELTLGRRLFEAESDFDVLRLIVDGEVPTPRSLRPDYPAPLEEVVMRALARAPADRFQGAGQMLDALEATARQVGLSPSARALEAWLDERMPQPPRPARAEPSTAAGTQEPVTAGEAAAAAPSAASASLRDGVRSPSDVGPSSAPLRQEVLAPRRSRARSLALLATVLGGAAVATVVWAPWAPSPPAALPPPSPAAANPGPTVPAPTERPLPPPLTGSPTAQPPPAPAAATAPHAEPTARVAPAASPERAPRAAHGTAPDPHGATAPALPAGQPMAPAAAEGELVLDAVPWCHVTVDGARRGETPLQIKVAAGPHSVRLDNEEFGIDRTVSLTVEPGKALRRNFKFPVGAPAPAAP